jgi:hypothetical protein
MGSELRTMLAAKDSSSFNSGSAKGLTCGINNEPSTLDGIVCHVSGHFDFLQN